ncbi:MAG TPA: YggS family pyridoxal phosphate-dependent enzyme, partial [Terriglobales bacterium]
MSEIAERIQQVRERMAAAARRAGRDPKRTTLMAVSKTVPPTSIVQAYAAGLRVFGESRVQEFAEKRPHLQELKDARWTLIGRLQSNKTAKAAELFDAVHSADSLRILERLNAAQEQLRRASLPVLIEINIGGEDAKAGLPPSSKLLQPILAAAARLPHIQLRGLMTVPPYT